MMILSARDVELVKNGTSEIYQDIGKAMSRYMNMMIRHIKNDGKVMSWSERLAWRGIAVRLQVVGLNVSSNIAREIYLS